MGLADILGKLGVVSRRAQIVKRSPRVIFVRVGSINDIEMQEILGQRVCKCCIQEGFGYNALERAFCSYNYDGVHTEDKR